MNLAQRRTTFGLTLAAMLAGAGSAPGSNCAGTSTGLVPLTSLGAGSYQGAQGGLYPGGVNARPASHEAAGVAIANTIVPLDTLGNPDPVNGRIVFVSIGMSNCTQEFSTFIPLANADPLRNPRVLLVDCALGGQAANLIKDPRAPYWDSVATRLRGHGSSPAQAQVAWIKEANIRPSGTFAASNDTLVWNLGSVVRNVHSKLPNVRQAFLTSRIYAGYATTALNPEPYSYESGFAVKRLIAAQIAGEDSLEWDATVGVVHAPWISWGPYLWADGLLPRSDGLTWACTDFSASDGTHPSASGRAKVADRLLAFARTDATAAPWYLAPGVVLDAPPRHGNPVSLSARPNPARGSVELALVVPPGERWTLEVVDAAGRRIRRLARSNTGATTTVRWDLRDDEGRRARAGVYWARLVCASAAASRALVLP